MLQEMTHPPEQLPFNEAASPIAAQLLEFCDSEFFQETLQNPEVNSSSKCCYEENPPFTTDLSMPPDTEKLNTFQDNNENTTPTPTPTTADTATSTPPTSSGSGTPATVSSNNVNNNNNDNLPIIFDSQDDLDNDISASIDFSSSPTLSIPQYITTQQDQFDLSSVQPQFAVTDVFSSEELSHYSPDPLPQLIRPPLSSVFEEDCLSSVTFNNSSLSCPFIPPAISSYMPDGSSMTSAISAETSGTFAGGMLMGSQWQPLDMDYQGDNSGIYCPDPIQRGFNPGDLQAFCNETQQLRGGVGSSTALASEISSMEDSAFKVRKLSAEQRKEKILRYLKKRNERNFSKKIKYACRKTLADSRPRVRGRFAKNDDFGETQRAACSNHEEYEDDEVITTKEEMVDSADIFAHISGVNSFKCNYSIQSWI